MGTIKMPLPVKLIMSMFTGETALFEQALEALTEQFGPADYGSTRMPFTHTEY
jgi:hypothetical protein